MNHNKEYELLTEEELKKADEKLREAENIEIPESLSKENIEKLIENVPQEVVPVTTQLPKKRNKKKIIFSSVSTAAAVIVAVTSVAIMKPWEKTKVEIKDSVVTENTEKAGNYSEIEALFAGYAEEYQKSLKEEKFDDIKSFFGGTKDTAILMEDAVEEGATLRAPQADSESGSAAQNTNTSANKTEDNNHGETNEQVQGVSEADIIKNDGKYLYIVNPENADWEEYYNSLALYENNKDGLADTTVKVQVSPGYNPHAKTQEPVEEEKETQTTAQTEKGGKNGENSLPELRYTCEISIVKPGAKGEMKTISKINVAKPQRKDIFFMRVVEMYVSGNRLIAVLDCQLREENASPKGVYGKYYDSYLSGKVGNITMAVSFDISDRQNPKEEWRVFQDGGYTSSRLIGDELVLLSNYFVDITEDVDVVKENCIPEISCDGKEFSRVSDSDICLMEEINDTRYLVASVLDTDDEKTLKTEAVLGAGDNVYCTTETLYATSTDYSETYSAAEVFDLSSVEKTQIYKFDIRNYNIKYLKSATISGSALNQFSIDEYKGFLRIATTSGNWGENLVNQVYILNEKLETAGILKDIAKGERIKSVRFTGDTAYVVTFVQTDPLFVIDLTNPTNPKILGELKIPGYSAYLHPVGEGLVMGVGVDGTETGTNGGMKVSLFDVSDPKKPIEAAKFTMDTVNSEYQYSFVESSAYYDHKALCWDKEEKVMYIPYRKDSRVWASQNGEELSYKSITGIIAVKVDEEGKTLSTAGDYITEATENALPNEITRTTYINNTIYGYSSYDGILSSFDKATQKQLYILDVSM